MNKILFIFYLHGTSQYEKKDKRTLTLKYILNSFRAYIKSFRSTNFDKIRWHNSISLFIVSHISFSCITNSSTDILDSRLYTQSVSVVTSNVSISSTSSNPSPESKRIPHAGCDFPSSLYAHHSCRHPIWRCMHQDFKQKQYISLGFHYHHYESPLELHKHLSLPIQALHM